MPETLQSGDVVQFFRLNNGKEHFLGVEVTRNHKPVQLPGFNEEGKQLVPWPSCWGIPKPEDDEWHFHVFSRRFPKLGFAPYTPFCGDYRVTACRRCLDTGNTSGVYCGCVIGRKGLEEKIRMGSS